jgi:hypothetical protein
MDFRQRLQRYLIGIGIGLLLSYLLLGDRLGNREWTPKARVKQRLEATLLEATPIAREQLALRGLELADVRGAIPAAKVDLGNTLRRGDSIFYLLDTELQGEEVRLIVLGLRDFDRDSTATLWELHAR